MYQQFSFSSETRGNIEILRLKGYLEGTGGTGLKVHIQKCLDSGLSRFVFDCSAIELISSPGVAALLDISGTVVDDFAGQIAVWGLDKHHSTVLEMSGLFFTAQQVASEEESIDYLNES
ncbi:MAG: anti-sigma factor antagonist [Erysipelotrichia bacterium]|nr:STAS domain-containing protein [Candidatus Riflebacteria bacterium]NCB40907.1 anti-sigma factor antagonist [Erysipelotrichia bacterium]